ncbi:MAG TPA: ABC transporter ATP-binding protein/permease [Euryarchaeota archaeon]|nr:ABC transporter ATP-binding protein/permease [Euryarchaeota archaeon]
MDRYRAPFIAALVIACVGTVLTLAGPNLISEITDLIEEGLAGVMDLEGIVSICLLLVCLYSVSAVLTFVQQYIMTTISQRTAFNFRRDISRKINRLPLRYFDTNTTGDVMSRITNDVDTLGQSMNQSISTMATAITLLGGSVIMMLYTNVTMAVTAILSSLVGFVFMAVVMGRSQKYFERQQDDLGDMNGHVEEMYSGHLVMKAYGGEKAAKAEFDRINESLYKSGFMSQFLGGLMMPFMNFIGNFGYVMVCIVGAMLCIDGRISFGVIVAFMIYVRLFTQPLTQISQAMVSMQAVAAAAERVFEFLDEPEMEDESDKNVRLDRVEGHVEFRDVHFGYSADKEIIHGFSADILPGQKVAIVGPTGAGKTTMVNLLMRFYEVTSGDILIDGVSTRNMRREDVHDLFCMVLQDTWLFEGTIRENIVYSNPDVSDERLDEVCKAVGLYHYIHTLPDGYDTVLGDNANLSAGQRQQVTIARAMVDGSPLLILDEATSSVDTRTERVIQEAMDRLTEGRTSFVIAHRLSTIRNSDLILVMRDGNIVEQGTHDQLLARGGFYADLYNSQFDPE